MDRAEEFEYILKFAGERDFEELIERRQLRSLWTAYCLRHNLDCDTKPYYETLRELWYTINKNDTGVVANDGWLCHHDFDLYMGADLS